MTELTTKENLAAAMEGLPKLDDTIKAQENLLKIHLELHLKRNAPATPIVDCGLGGLRRAFSPPKIERVSLREAVLAYE